MKNDKKFKWYMKMKRNESTR